jgi:hypothetical protein
MEFDLVGGLTMLNDRTKHLGQRNEAKSLLCLLIWSFGGIYGQVGGRHWLRQILFYLNQWKLQSEKGTTCALLEVSTYLEKDAWDIW